jgi:hypothetical protein
MSNFDYLWNRHDGLALEVGVDRRDNESRTRVAESRVMSHKCNWSSGIYFTVLHYQVRQNRPTELFTYSK